MQPARQLAENLKCVSQNVATKPFNFRPRKMLASIGHRNAVAVIYGVQLSGFIAWILWRGIYLAKLPTFSRKLEVDTTFQDPNKLKRPAGLAPLNDRPGCLDEMIEKVDSQMPLNRHMTDLSYAGP